MFSNIMIIIGVILSLMLCKVLIMYFDKIDDEITDMEIQITDLEVKNTKLENEIKTISQNLKINL